MEAPGGGSWKLRPAYRWSNEMGRATAGVFGMIVGLLRMGELEKLAKVGRIDFSKLNWYRKE
jgi:hypothetical protein